MGDVRRSIVASKNLKKGTVLTEECFEYKRPGSGLKPEFSEILIGKKLKRDLMEDELIKLEDI